MLKNYLLNINYKITITFHLKKLTTMLQRAIYLL